MIQLSKIRERAFFHKDGLVASFFNWTHGPQQSYKLTRQSSVKLNTHTVKTTLFTQTGLITPSTPCDTSQRAISESAILNKPNNLVKRYFG